MRQSIATLDSPEFINLQPLDINPLMSKCEIKVLYTGKNRNRSFITKEVATEMAKTLRGAPIVGYYRDQKEDFDDHGERITFDSDGFHTECLTVPYGFVSPDAQVWFKDFEDTDEFGNVEVRTYLMTTGYIWTGQFEEAKRVVEIGNNHSMELDKKTLNGTWAEDSKTQMEFFIINDAIFSKLCILGEDVEPCFEGSTITSPKVSSSFAFDNNFKKTLYDMMQQLQFALQGGQSMFVENTENPEAVTPEVTESPAAATETEFAQVEAEVEEVTTEETTEIDSTTEETPEADFKKEESKEEDSKEEAPTEEEPKEDEEKKKAIAKCALLEQELETLKADYAKLQESHKELSDFKLQVENEKKDNLINQTFAILSYEDKKELIENKEKYSLDELEKELSVICFRKKVNFNLEDNSKNQVNTEDVVTTFNVSNTIDDSVPAWIKALQNTQNNRNI